MFTPFWRACRRVPVSAPLLAPQVRWAQVDAGEHGRRWVSELTALPEPFAPQVRWAQVDAGEHGRRWVSELTALPEPFVHKPWAAPEAILAAAGITPGHSYPHPVVDHREARQAALDAYAAVRGSPSPPYSPP